jgi:hypothetical protein
MSYINTRSRRGVQHYVIKFVSDLRQVCGFLQVYAIYMSVIHDYCMLKSPFIFYINKENNVFENV